MNRFFLALLLMLGLGIALPGAALAKPDLPEPPRPGDLALPSDPPGPAPRPPTPGERLNADDDRPWWNPLGLFDGDDDDNDNDNDDGRPWWNPLGLFDDDDDGHRGHGHDKHEGKKQKHREKHDD